MLSERDIKSRWWTSNAISAVLLLTIVTVWMLDDPTPNTNQLESETAADRQYSALNRSIGRNREQEERILTGVYVEEFNFTNANDVDFKARIFQLLPRSAQGKKRSADGKRDVHTCIQHFNLSEAVNAPLVRLQHREEFDDDLYCRWQVYGRVRQSFEYQKYPLDHKIFWLALQGRSLSENYRLLPWTDAYPATGVQNIFGFSDRMVLGGWDVIETYFDLKIVKERTNFGLLGEYRSSEAPVLHYNIVVQRKFGTAFVIHLVPMITVSMLLFAMLLSFTRDSEKRGITGFSFMGVLGTVSALFFVVVLSHVSVRQNYPTHGVLYIEYFYLTLYVLMVAVVANSYALSKADEDDADWFTNNDNLIPKLMYWPASLAFLSVVSITAL